MEWSMGPVIEPQAWKMLMLEFDSTIFGLLNECDCQATVVENKWVRGME